MTALAGFWSLDGRDPLGPVRRMLKAQALYRRADADWSDGVAALARRLFPTLPEEKFDRGPAIAAGGRLALVADVRLDNRGEIEAALGLGGEARTTSDSALLLAALQRWQEGALDRLVGDFAFALWDGDRRRLLLGRDYSGQRPLHYHRGSGFVAFASMPKGLHALPEIPYRLNEESALGFLALMPESGPATLFEGIERVEPGHVVALTPEGLEARRYWQPRLDP